MNSSEMVERIEVPTLPRGEVARALLAATATPAPPPLPEHASERIRLAAVRLEGVVGGPARPGRLIVFASAEPGDGTTTTALYVADTLARGLGRRVALLEGNLARPGLAQALQRGAGVGLGHVLAGDAPLEVAALRAGDGGALVVPAGGPAVSETARLVALVAQLRGELDYVLVDAPPLATSADAAVLGRAADGVVLVVRAGATRRDALAAALDALVDAPLAGCVLVDHEGHTGSWAARVARSARSERREED